MKLTRLLTVGGVEVPLVNDLATLELSRPGRALFSVKANAPLSGLVEFSIGYDPLKLRCFFRGYVENSMTVHKEAQRLSCRELSGALDRLMPLNLRHVSMHDVLTELVGRTSLVFVLPEQSQLKVPHFYSWGGGYHVMDAIGKAFEIDRFFWQQQGDGKIYVGSWANSFWADKPLPFGAEWMTEHGPENQARIPALPPLRPGVKLQQGNKAFVVTRLQLSGSYMDITWSENPWSRNQWSSRLSV